MNIETLEKKFEAMENIIYTLDVSNTGIVYTDVTINENCELEVTIKDRAPSIINPETNEDYITGIFNQEILAKLKARGLVVFRELTIGYAIGVKGREGSTSFLQAMNQSKADLPFLSLAVDSDGKVKGLRFVSRALLQILRDMDKDTYTILARNFIASLKQEQFAIVHHSGDNKFIINDNNRTTFSHLARLTMVSDEALAQLTIHQRSIFSEGLDFMLVSSTLDEEALNRLDLPALATDGEKVHINRKLYHDLIIERVRKRLNNPISEEPVKEYLDLDLDEVLELEDVEMPDLDLAKEEEEEWKSLN